MAITQSRQVVERGEVAAGIDVVPVLEEWLTQPEGLAGRLRALRVRAGLSGKELTSATGWDQRNEFG